MIGQPIPAVLEAGSDETEVVRIVAFVGGQQDGYDVRVKAVVLHGDGALTAEWLESLTVLEAEAI